MNTEPVTPETLSSSVIAVPPLARNADLSLNRAENEKLIRHLEAGGVRTLLYGGNAVLHHVAVSEYADLLGMLAGAVSGETVVIPSVGPGYGMMMDQARVLRDFPFPTAMVLPTRDVVTPEGVASGVRRFVEALGRPAVLYVKHDGYIDVAGVKRLMGDGLLSWVKYAVVRDDPAEDVFLRGLVDTVGPERIVSGIGEQPAVAHMRDFGLVSFTSGCVCVAPGLSMDLLRAVQEGDMETAGRIQGIFRPLEDLRNSINPVRVLHAAVTLAGIADMGPILPLLSAVGAADVPAIKEAAVRLLEEGKSRGRGASLP